MDEFELIARLLRPLAGEGGPGLGLRDDAAVLTPPDGCAIVLTKDMMVAGRHFFADDAPDLVARKLLRVNLSDLAAMGARPLGYLLGLAFPDRLDADFLRRFAKGLGRDQQRYGLALYGGDTVSGAGRLCLSLTALGAVPRGRALLRSGARPGDGIYVSGTIGDAALGLLALRGDIIGTRFLTERYYLPEPRLGLGAALPGVASAAADVSDGLIADLGHIAAASGCLALIWSDRVPLSPSTRRLTGGRRDLLMTALTGGDDYELVFTAPPGVETALQEIAGRTATPIARIGEMVAGKGVRLIGPDGSEWTVERAGFTHD